MLVKFLCPGQTVIGISSIKRVKGALCACRYATGGKLHVRVHCDGNVLGKLVANNDQRNFVFLPVIGYSVRTLRRLLQLVQWPDTENCRFKLRLNFTRDILK